MRRQGRFTPGTECSFIDPMPDGAVAYAAAYGIAREALTNVARHSPRAATTVTCLYNDACTEVAVTSAPPPAVSVAHGAGLGSGRGQGFLRSPAREAGGTLTSGPTAEGGWEVRATLPGRTAATASTGRPAPYTYRLAQVVTAAGLVLQPLLLQPLLPLLIVREGTASKAQRVTAP